MNSKGYKFEGDNKEINQFLFDNMINDEEKSEDQIDQAISEDEPPFRVFYDQNEIKETYINQKRDLFSEIVYQKTQKPEDNNLIDIKDYFPKENMYSEHK